MAPRASRLARPLFLAGELVRVADTLRIAQIRFLVLKGLPFLREVYGDLAGRDCADIDLLVAPSDAVRARDVLASLGYAGDPRLSLESELPNNFEYTLRAERPAGTAVVDLHWHALSDFHHRARDEHAWRDAREVRFEGQGMLVPSREFSLLHVAAHHHQHAFSVPRILQDLTRAYVAWEAVIDWKHFFSLGRALGLAATWDFVADVAEHVAGLPPTAPRFGSTRARAALFAAARAQSGLNAFSVRRDYPLYRHMLIAASLGDPRSVPRFVRHNLFPTRERLATLPGDDVTSAHALRYARRWLKPFRRVFGD